MKIAAGLCAVVLGLATHNSALAQVGPYGPYSYDLMPPYAAARIVRSTGLIPVAPPVRTGASYVVRAIDRFGVPMRVVIDARSGEILALRRIAAVPPGYGYPPDASGPRYDPYGDATGPMWRAPPRTSLPAEPPSEDRPGPQTGLQSTAPAHSAAIAPAHPPVPRARPNLAKEPAAVTPATAPPVADKPDKAEKPTAKSAAPDFPPVQSLE